MVEPRWVILKKPSMPRWAPAMVWLLTGGSIPEPGPVHYGGSRGAPRRPADAARVRQPHLLRRRRRAARRRRGAHRGGRHGAVAGRVRGPAAVLRPAPGLGQRVVAVDLSGRRRSGPLRPGVLPAPPQDAAGARRVARTGCLSTHRPLLGRTAVSVVEVEPSAVR